jgi:hypothetical protein
MAVRISYPSCTFQESLLGVKEADVNHTPQVLRRQTENYCLVSFHRRLICSCQPTPLTSVHPLVSLSPSPPPPPPSFNIYLFFPLNSWSVSLSSSPSFPPPTSSFCYPPFFVLVQMKISSRLWFEYKVMAIFFCDPDIRSCYIIEI